MNSESPEPLPHRDRVRRIVLLCCAFARNVAYYRAGWADRAQPLLSELHPHASFWRQVNGNFLDMAVLDWCKLFGDPKETPQKRLAKHHWRRVVSDPDAFEAGLLTQLGTDADGFAALIGKMRDYRDRFVAHLDNGLTMNIPELDPASAAVTFYHRHIVEREAQPGELDGLAGVAAFARGFGQCADEAAQVYQVGGLKIPFAV
nr:hypothetical protein [uncultured Rhodopila sp.]